jgi:hypothetical protein
MKPYSILIKGTGPCGTGDKNSSGDLLAQSLAQSLKEAGHDVTHASIEIDGEALLLHGQMVTHPEPPKEKKGGAPEKKKGAAPTPPKPASAPTGPAQTPEGKDEKNEPEGTPEGSTEGTLEGNERSEQTSDESQTNSAGDQA